MKHQKAQDRILDLLKTTGPQTAIDLGKTLGMTSMGARQHLERLEAEGVVVCEDVKQGVGRPKRLWSLTEKSQQHFPDRHDQLTVDMLISIKDVFGEKGLDDLIEHRSASTAKLYQSAVNAEKGLEDKVQALVRVRTEEGYMADYQETEEGFLFIENHCPICSAAKSCQGFCRSELEIFQGLFAGVAEVERLEHILQGARRCAYAIRPFS